MFVDFEPHHLKSLEKYHKKEYQVPMKVIR